MRVLIFSFVFPSCYCLFGFDIGWAQTVGVKGKLFCNGKPRAETFVILYEKENIWDSKLATVTSDQNGLFKISGTATEISQIEPQLRIWTMCRRRGEASSSDSHYSKKICIDIPTKYISKGERVKQYWQVNIELSRDGNLCPNARMF